MKIPGLLVVLLLLVAKPTPAEVVRCEVTADNSIVLVESEEGVNAGQASRIRIKGNQHIVAMQFDMTPVEGRLVTSATLVCYQGEQTIDHVTLSTIATPWSETKSSALTAGVDGVEGWGRAGVRFPAVCGSNGFTLVSQAPTVLRDGVYCWSVDPDLVHANAIGAAYGLAIHEALSDYSRNPTICSREQSNKKPYLLVELGGKAPKPEPPTGMGVQCRDGLEKLCISFDVPKQGFAYRVLVDGKPLPRFNIPFYTTGERTVIPIRDIPFPVEVDVEMSVQAISRTGEVSDPVFFNYHHLAGPDLKFPALKKLEKMLPRTDGISVIPVQDKYDREGRAVGDLPAGYRFDNELFDGRDIYLSAARGEVVGFQMLLKGTGDVTMRLDVPGIRTEAFRALYVESRQGYIPDPLVPFKSLTLSKDQDVPVVVDLYVPFDFDKRVVEGAVHFSDGRSVPIHLQIHDFALPREASFLCEMNGYGLPDNLSEYYALQEVAYDHRVHCNILHYSHSTAAPGARKCVMDMVMDMGPKASGRRMDDRRYNDIKPGAKTAYWDDFIEAFGPYLSGSYFKDGHRGAIPAPGFYLTFHESWPLNVRAYFDGSLDAYKAFEATPVYAETFVNIARDFISAAKREGWTETGFQIYLNNKGELNDLRKNPWILDEPTAYWDYRALAYYGDLVRKAKGEDCPITLDYRIDISRPHYDRGELKDKVDLSVVSTHSMRQYTRLVQDRAEESQEKIWVYGSSNPVEESNRTIHAWVLEAFRLGASGVVPWQTINKDGSALTKADTLGLFIFVKEPGSDKRVVYHSMRLKAFRRAQQDIEYLNSLKRRLHFGEDIDEFIDHYLSLKGETHFAYAADAGTATYGAIRPGAFAELRRAAAWKIQQPK